jgi:hypothetical protein
LMRSLVMRAIRCSGYTATVAGVEARAQYDS